MSWRASWQRLGPAVRSVSYLRPRQIAALVRHRARGPARVPERIRSGGVECVRLPEAFVGPSPEGTPDGNGGIALLGQPAHDPLRFGWNDSGDPLWDYTLHYHGWLNHPRVSFDSAVASVLDWMVDVQSGTGWEPYPTAMRLLHWLALLGRGGARLGTADLEAILGSMAAQLEHLAANVEVHLDGNHVWTDCAALVACGLGLDGALPRALVERWSPVLVDIVDDQVGSDGVHRERTPSYHCLLAEQLAIVVALADARAPALAVRLRPALERMIAITPVFMHPDGDVALWGDSQLGAQVTPRRLLARAGELPDPGGDIDAIRGGFARRSWGPWTLLWNIGGVGMDHQVGHIHGDCLAIELSLGGARVVVDAGTGTYVRGPERAYARSTAAHNTVTVGVGDPDQHELWASHRIGARAQPVELAGERYRLAGAVLGWQSKARHRREIAWDGREIAITDTVEPGDVPATVRYHVPAGVSLRETPQGWVGFVAKGGAFEIACQDAALVVTDAPGWSAMNVIAPRKCLAARLGPDGITVRLRALK
ncbi:MAG TPA: alginate lyase family protein [Nannocystaceae bacterium]|nr:alginate lyase family protein [Nannocystaceae bacterium]